MKSTDHFTLTIDRFPKGIVFTYEDFSDEVKKKEAIIKTLNRMNNSGNIVKLSKGKYNSPKLSSINNLPAILSANLHIYYCYKEPILKCFTLI